MITSSDYKMKSCHGTQLCGLFASKRNIKNHQTVKCMLLKSEDEVYRQSYQMLTEHKDLMDRSV